MLNKVAISNVIGREIIAPALKGANVFEQRAIDMKMLKLDGTPTKSKLGANAHVLQTLQLQQTAVRLKQVL